MKGTDWIAIIDDDLPLRDSVTRMLDALGLGARSYESAEAFLSAMPDGLPKCLIVDMQMPGMTGLELVRHLNGRGIRIPAIVITAARVDAEMREEWQAAGAVAILPKPWRTEAFIAAIERAQGSNSSE